MIFNKKNPTKNHTKKEHICARCHKPCKIVHQAPKSSAMYVGKHLCKSCLDIIKRLGLGTATTPASAVGKKTYHAHKKVLCHDGNRLVLKLGEKGAGLYAGGWTRGADPRRSWGVIDLANYGKPEEYSNIETLTKAGDSAFANTLKAASGYTPAGPWLSLPIVDYSYPMELDYDFWQVLANDVRVLLDNGTNVLVACVGGHGRTGLVVAILAGILRPDLVGKDPVEWLRDVYCKDIIETYGQHKYVFRMLGRDIPKWLADKKDDNWGVQNYYTSRHNYTTSKVKDDDYLTQKGDGWEGVSPASSIKQLPIIDNKQVKELWEYDEVVVVEYEDGSFDSLTYSEFDSCALYSADILDNDINDIHTELSDMDCPECNGHGYILFTGGEAALCNQCDGFGIAQTQEGYKTPRALPMPRLDNDDIDDDADLYCPVCGRARIITYQDKRITYRCPQCPTLLEKKNPNVR